MRCDDVIITEDFYTDYENIPKKVKDKLEYILTTIHETKTFPRAFHPHKARLTENEIWIGHVTRNKIAWRVLFEWKDTIAIFLRIVTHTEMEIMINRRL